MTSLIIVTCRTCGRVERYQGEYATIVAAIGERFNGITKEKSNVL